MATFKESLCGCINDIFSCYIALCCPGGLCYLSARAASEATKRSMCPTATLSFGLCCIGMAINRTTIRGRYNYTGSCAQDLLLHCCCSMCAVTQEYREVMKKEYIELVPLRK